NTSINRNIALSLDGEYNSDRISQLSETNRTMLNNKTGAGISLRFLGKVLGELSLSGGFVLTERKPTVDSISFLDSSALFKPDVDTLNSEYYYTKRVSREGGLSYKKGSETLDASIQVRTNWDSDYLSPTGIVFPSKESFGVNPEISVDYRLNTLFNCSAKMGGETQNGYRRYQKLYSSFDFSVAAKYVRLSTSLFWEKEKRELGEINNLEWKIDLLLTI
ncbi:MAG: hypothetical protein JNL74_24490, partial [Fibrobacteres bacterium]|nr:hypothetical protein [Fibrobacterota bacterium]